jgi:hypothetical protein
LAARRDTSSRFVEYQAKATVAQDKKHGTGLRREMGPENSEGKCEEKENEME